MEARVLISQINAELCKAFYDYRGLYFFGSRCRGDYHDYSDYDMVFVFTTRPDWHKKDRARDVVYRQELEADVVIDSKYYSLEDVENYQTPFLENVYKEGEFYGV